MRYKLLLLFFASLPLPAQLAVRSAASYASEIAPGSVAALFTDDLAIPTVVGQVDRRGRWPRELGGVQVQVDGRPAGLLFVSPTQINFVIPIDLVPGTATLSVVESRRGTLAGGSATVVASAPALFSTDGSGRGQGLAFNRTTEDWGPFSVSTQANPGCDKRTRVSVLATGFRSAASEGSDPLSSNLAEISSVQIENGPGGAIELSGDDLLYVGPEESLEGVDRIDFILPAELENAGAVSIRAMVGGAASNPVLIDLTPSMEAPADECTADGFVFVQNTVADLLAGDLWDVTDPPALLVHFADAPSHWPLMGVGTTAEFQRNGEVIVFGAAGAPELIWSDPQFPPAVRTLTDEPIPFVAIAAGNPDHAIVAEAVPGRPVHPQVVELAEIHSLALAGVRVTGRFTALSYSVAHNLLKEGTPLTDPSVDKAPFQLFFDAEPEAEWELSGFYAGSSSTQRLVSVVGAPVHLHGFQTDRSSAGHVGANEVASATIRLYPLSAPIVQDADLAVQALGFDGERVSFEVLNRGASAVARTTVQGLESERVVFQLALPGFEPGESKMLEAPVTASSDGSFRIVVDPFNDILESDEANNIAHVATPGR